MQTLFKPTTVVLSVDFFHISFHQLQHPSAEVFHQFEGFDLMILESPVISPCFKIDFESFSKKFTTEFQASYEHDGSFAYFANQDSISGQIGGDESGHVAFLEVHQCRNPDNFNRLVDILPPLAAVQLMEAGCFLNPESYLKLICQLNSGRSI